MKVIKRSWFNFWNSGQEGSIIYYLKMFGKFISEMIHYMNMSSEEREEEKLTKRQSQKEQNGDTKDEE